ncbi:hypothetical protein [Bernardetia sp.]|uniref:hypothetical protein n=1 Tax=Bernardetia sp. TaxID=1937974 RepID=UPI0025C683D7|nr:hypothetical protein [Bernardetia sp.]
MKFFKQFIIPLLYLIPVFYEIGYTFLNINVTEDSVHLIYGIGVIFFIVLSFGMIWSKDWYKMYSESGVIIKLPNKQEIEIWNLENVFVVFVLTLSYPSDMIHSWTLYYLFAFGTFTIASIRIFRINSDK